MSLSAPGARWLAFASLAVCALAGCGQSTRDPARFDTGGADDSSPPGGATNHAGANSAGGGASNGGASNGGGRPSLDIGGTGIELGGGSNDSEPKPVEPHAGLPCENPQPYPDGGGYLVCEDHSLRRGEPTDCPSVLPRAEPAMPLFLDECELDTDCTASAHGYCSVGGCKYGCVNDEECGPQGACLCGPEIGHCGFAGCHSDDDCPAGYPCTGNHPYGVDTATFICQTPLDECRSDYDCPGPRWHCVHDEQHRYCFHDTVG